jgi:RNA polymerase sigma-70 factor (ECF subfamily)
MTSDAGFELFVAREYGALVHAVVMHTRDRELAHDVVQEALIRAGMRWTMVQACDSPRAWVLRVAFNLTHSTFRRRRSARRAWARIATSANTAARPVAEPRDPVDESLVAALQDLSPRQRQVVVLRHVSGMSVTETAAAMNVSEDAVRSLTSRGLARLRKTLETRESNHTDSRPR